MSHANDVTLPCGAGSAVPREGFDLSVIILASLLVFPMLGCRHSLIRLLAIYHVFVKWNAHFQTFLLVNTSQSGHYLVFFALSVKVVLQEHLFVDHF